MPNMENVDDHAIFTCNEVFLVVWKDNTSLAAVDTCIATIDDLDASFPGAVRMLAVIKRSAPPPTQPAREAISALFKAVEGKVCRSAVVFEGTSFRAAIVRSIITGLVLLARQNFPHRIFATADDAIDWLLEETPDDRAARVDLRRQLEVLDVAA